MSTSSSSLQAAGPSPYVKDVTVQNFMAEVIQASLQVPVLVYFTAEWCGPCKQYGPTLEKVVNAAKGRVKLARVDIDKNPQLAQQFRIQSVPMLYIFLQGQPLDGFAGALPESQLKELLAQIMGAGPEEEQIKATLEGAAAALAASKVEEAEQAYKAILGVGEENFDAVAGLARCFIAQGRLAQAKELLGGVTEAGKRHEAIVAAGAALALAEAAPSTGNADALAKKLEKDPADHQARYDLANALFAAGRQEEAIAALLAIIGKSRDWNEGAARAQLLKFFEALGHAHPLTVQGRRKLSSILFA